MPRDEDYTRKKLAAYLPTMWTAAVKGVRESLDDYPKTAHKHRKNTTRSITRDHIVDNLRGELMLDPHVTIKDRNQTTYFEVMGEFRVMAKMADDAGNVRLNPNQTSLAYEDQREAQLFASEDLDEATHLFLSYVPNTQSPRDPFVYVICPKPGGHHWMFEIEPRAAATVPEIKPNDAGDAGDSIVRIPAQPKTDDESKD